LGYIRVTCPNIELSVELSRDFSKFVE